MSSSFIEEIVWVYCIKGRAEVDEKDAGSRRWMTLSVVVNGGVMV